MNQQFLNKEFKDRFSELRIIINSWNLMPSAPKGEFDSLNHKILSCLFNEKDFETIQNTLESELVINYGFFRNEIDSEKFTQEIIDWWNDTYDNQNNYMNF